MEYYLAIKMSFATTWMELDYLLLNKLGTERKIKVLICKSRNVDLKTTEYNRYSQRLGRLGDGKDRKSTGGYRCAVGKEK